MKITTDLDATVLFIIAKDIKKMEAKLDIDENDIGQMQKGQKVNFYVGTYPDQKFKGIISSVSFSPQLKNNVISYKAVVDINNDDYLLRPGMTINAKIKVAKQKNCLSINGQAFQIDLESLEEIAKKINFQIEPIKKSMKKSYFDNKKNDITKFIWLVDNKKFIEKPIKIGLTDDNFFQIKDGINESDKIIIDIEEHDEMENLYNKIFKGSL